MIAENANKLPYDIILAGRDANKVRRLANSLARPWRCGLLEDPNSMDQMLANVDVVLHAAGPFSATAVPMVEACLRNGTHYLDIGGELPVFQQLGGYDGPARESGIPLMPGVGFAIVASGCLTAHIKTRMPSARNMRLGISMPQSFSRGSIRTMSGLVRNRVSICRNGKISTIPVGRLERAFDYGQGDRWSTCVNWPDVYTATTTTEIQSMEVYMEADFLARTLYHTGALLATPLQHSISQWVLSAYANIWPSRPDPKSASTDEQVIVAEAEDDGDNVRVLGSRQPMGTRLLHSRPRKF